jgi:RNA polymerase sigma-70 factor, ECF subfamily
MREQAEDLLLAGLAEGREDDFAALYVCFARPLHRVAWSVLGSRQDAEDAVQEVFLGLVRSRATLAKVESLPAYLFSSLRHAAARLATRKKTPVLPAGDPPTRDPNADREIDPEMFRLLERGLAALPREQREVLSLKIYGGLTFAQVAAVLGIRPNTAASRYRYALEKLRAILDAGCHETRTTSTKPS